MSPVLYLVRHGQTDWNRDHRVQGSTDVPLNAAGRAQALEAAAELADVPVGAVISSDLSRARDTAAPIATAHGLELVIAEPLRERHFGSAEGRYDEDLYREYGPTKLREFWRSPDSPFPGGGETVRAHQDRVGAYLDLLLADPPAGHIVLVSHGGTVRRALNHLGHVPVENAAFEPIANGSVHIVEV